MTMGHPPPQPFSGGEHLPLQDGVKADSWVRPLPSRWVWVWPDPDPLSSQACAVALMAVGIGTLFIFNQTVSQGTASSVLLVVIIAVGAFLFLVAIVGCCGACQESYCLMLTVSGQWAGGCGLLEGHLCGGAQEVGGRGKPLGAFQTLAGPQQASLTRTPDLTPVLRACSLSSSCLLLCWWR